MSGLLRSEYMAVFDAVAAGTHQTEPLTIPHRAPKSLVLIKMSKNNNVRATALRLFPDHFMMIGKDLCSVNKQTETETTHGESSLWAIDAAPLLPTRDATAFKNDHAEVGWKKEGKCWTKFIITRENSYRETYGRSRRLKSLVISIGARKIAITYKHGALKYVVTQSELRRDETVMNRGAVPKRTSVLRSEDAHSDFIGKTNYYYLPGVFRHGLGNTNIRATYHVVYPRNMAHKDVPGCSYPRGLCVDYCLNGRCVERLL